MFNLEMNSTIDTIVANPEDGATILANLIANGLQGKVVLKIDDNVKRGSILAFNSFGPLELSFNFSTGDKQEN